MAPPCRRRGDRQRRDIGVRRRRSTDVPHASSCIPPGCGTVSFVFSRDASRGDGEGNRGEHWDASWDSAGRRPSCSDRSPWERQLSNELVVACGSGGTRAALLLDCLGLVTNSLDRVHPAVHAATAALVRTVSETASRDLFVTFGGAQALESHTATALWKASPTAPGHSGNPPLRGTRPMSRASGLPAGAHPVSPRSTRRLDSFVQLPMSFHHRWMLANLSGVVPFEFRRGPSRHLRA